VGNGKVNFNPIKIINPQTIFNFFNGLKFFQTKSTIQKKIHEFWLFLLIRLFSIFLHQISKGQEIILLIQEDIRWFIVFINSFTIIVIWINYKIALVTWKGLYNLLNLFKGSQLCLNWLEHCLWVLH